MLDRLTVPAQNMLKLAAREARPLRARQVGTEHVLIGLCTRCGATTKLLSAAGVSADGVRAGIDPLADSLGVMPPGIRLPFSPCVLRLLVRTLALAPADSGSAPGTDLVLLALTLEEHGMARRILCDLETDVPALVETTITRVAEWDPGIRERLIADDERWSEPHVAAAAVRNPFAATAVDLQDGLIPADRLVLEQLRPRMIKCSRLVSNDDLLYTRLVRMVHPATSRYPLLEGHGNFGNIDGYDAAGSQYTEARASPLLADAAAVPMILVNGAAGIPPHNLREVADTVLAYLDNPATSTKHLLRTLHGPDFPTGGVIANPDALAGIYETGVGELTLRGRVQTEPTAGGSNLVITELPYGVNKGSGVRDQIIAAIRTQTLTGISDVSDESGRADGMRLVLGLAPGIDPDALVAALYRHTWLQITVPVRLEAVLKGRPEPLNLRELLAGWLSARRAVSGDAEIREGLERTGARHADERRTLLA